MFSIAVIYVISQKNIVVLYLFYVKGKDPVPSLTMNDKALALKDHIPEKYLKRSTKNCVEKTLIGCAILWEDNKNRKQPGANRRQQQNRPNDGLPTVPQRVK